MHNYESSNGVFPPGGESTNFNVSPAKTQFVDGGWSTLARILPYLEGGASFNALNFNIAEYNSADGSNYTGASQVVAVFLCPSSVPSPGGGRDGVDPLDPFSQISGGYGYNDYGPTVYTDISPIGATSGVGATPATPYRDKNTRANGLLKQGKTKIAEITDGTSNTIAIAEDAGRDSRYLSPYTEGYWDGVITRQAAMALINANDPGPVDGYAAFRRYWRWAEPDEGFGVSGGPNNKFRPDNEGSNWPTTNVTAGNNAGNNDEIASFHPGGANILFGDGSVRFLKDSVNPVTLRGLVTLSGGEVVSADQY
jgi:prepilin-type processing-associated H-X9-DG protein